MAVHGAVPCGGRGAVSDAAVAYCTMCAWDRGGALFAAEAGGACRADGAGRAGEEGAAGCGGSGVVCHCRLCWLGLV